ncbi:MAG: response regulator FixJ [Pseudorhodoplanes sp.]|uniref:response regulator FixJ n=1 Tax=Pseudorhodoplanes sp. TaxID=1934341 RepID=UPI003D0EEBF7
MPDQKLVHVIDDDDAVRDSLSFLLRAANFDVATYQSAAQFLQTFTRDMNGCVITDVRMPDVSGLDLLRRLRELACTVPVIVMTGHGDIQLAVEAMKAGALDFLEKPFDDERVLAAVRQALEARRADSERSGRRSEIEERLASLSQRERQVLDGLVAGLPNKTIAHDLGISPRTVEVYRANVMTKMQAGSLSELVRLVLLVQAS